MFLLSVRLLVIIFMLLQNGILCLECHTCTSVISEECGSKFNPTTATIETCEVFETLCVKATMNLLRVNIVTRGCTVNNACRSWDDCTTCNRSLCNSAFSAMPSIVSISIIFVHTVKNFL